jgi:hypothetical protein
MAGTLVNRTLASPKRDRGFTAPDRPKQQSRRRRRGNSRLSHLRESGSAINFGGGFCVDPTVSSERASAEARVCEEEGSRSRTQDTRNHQNACGGVSVGAAVPEHRILTPKEPTTPRNYLARPARFPRLQSKPALRLLAADLSESSKTMETLGGLCRAFDEFDDELVDIEQRPTKWRTGRTICVSATACRDGLITVHREWAHAVIASLEHAPYGHQPAKRTAGVLAARATPDRFRPPRARDDQAMASPPPGRAVAFFALQRCGRAGACGALDTLAGAGRGFAEQVCSLNASVEPAEKFARSSRPLSPAWLGRSAGGSRAPSGRPRANRGRS